LQAVDVVFLLCCFWCSWSLFIFGLADSDSVFGSDFAAIKVTSSPSSYDSSESTGAVSPSGIPMYKRVPSSKDSNSIVALSVSISARISPSFILSPTFFKPSRYRSFRHSIAQTRHCYFYRHNIFIVYEV
jgi:hypothetical protein